MEGITSGFVKITNLIVFILWKAFCECAEADIGGSLMTLALFLLCFLMICLFAKSQMCTVRVTTVGESIVCVMYESHICVVLPEYLLFGSCKSLWSLRQMSSVMPTDPSLQIQCIQVLIDFWRNFLKLTGCVSERRIVSSKTILIQRARDLASMARHHINTSYPAECHNASENK